MHEQESSEIMTQLTAWLKNERASLNDAQKILRSRLSTEVVEFLKNEINDDVYDNYDYIYREVNHIQSELNKNSTDFKRALEACKRASLDDFILRGSYLLPTRIRNAIRLLFFLEPKEYIKLLNHKIQPLWTFPLFDKDLNEKIYISEFIPAMQALYLEVKWEESKRNAKEEKLDLKWLTDLKMRIPVEHWLMFCGSAFEESLRNSFNSSAMSKKVYMGKLKNDLIEILVSHFSQVKSTKKIVSVFLKGLVGRVNKESWLGALYIASLLINKGNEISCNNGKLLRTEVIEEYPNLWGDTIYLSGEMSIELIHELAVTFYCEVKDPINLLMSMQEIDFPELLWKYRDSHDYEQYLKQRKLCLIHLLLLTLMFEKQIDKQKGVPTNFEKYKQLYMEYCKQWDDHLIAGEELILDELIAHFAALVEHFGNMPESMHQIFSILALPECYPNALSKIDKGSNEYKNLEEIVMQRVSFFLPSLRDAKIITLIKKTYNLSLFDLCIKLSENLKIEQIQDQGTKFLIAKLYLSALLQSSCNKKSQLEVALALSEKVQRTRYVVDDQLNLLIGYLLEKMVDMQLILPALKIPPFITKTSNVRGSEFKESLAYVRAGLVIRLIEADSTNMESYMIILEKDLEIAKQIPQVRGVVFLMEAWLMSIQGKNTQMNEYIKHATEYMEQNNQEIDALPAPLIKFVTSKLDDDDHA